MNIAGLLQELGSDPVPIFAGAGFKTGLFADPDTEVPYVAASRLLERCVQATGCQHFGLLLGASASPSSLGVAGFMLYNAPDVGTALRNLAEYLDLHDQGGIVTLNLQGGATHFGYAILQNGVAAADQIHDIALAMACKIMRGFFGAGWKSTEVLLTRQLPKNAEAYRKYFRAPLHFNSEHNAIVFPTYLLNQPIATADPLLHKHLKKEAKEQHIFRDSNILGEVRTHLRRLLISHACTSAEVAGRLCIHERTLHRKLRKEGTSFQHELDNIRRGVAQQLLTGSRMSLTKIASTLNYADKSAFSRAFKRWTGITPTQWRARTRSGPPIKQA
jgi:AraC-like DNA-binding protein